MRKQTRKLPSAIFVIRNADGQIVRLLQDAMTPGALRGIIANNHVMHVECPTCGDDLSHCPDLRELLTER